MRGTVRAAGGLAARLLGSNRGPIGCLRVEVAPRIDPADDKRAERGSCPDRNIWRLERAERVAVLIDAARYFGALRETLLKAQSSVFIIGWDLDSRTRLVDETAPPRDPYPETFVHFLTALVRERPQLFVHLLVWDYSMLYALEREPFPFVSLGLRTPPRIRLCFDDNLPAGASHHQKLVVVDDAVAFCGGLDITIRRWDTTEHRPNEPRRIDPTGASYLPFHDLQAIVDGKAALALARLVRDRWATAACTAASAPNPIGDPWPVSVCPEFTGIDVGIARTSAATEHGHEIREIEALFVDAIDCATRAIYIENQFLTATRIAERLAKRLREQPALEVVIVVPRRASFLAGSAGHANGPQPFHADPGDGGSGQPCRRPVSARQRRRNSCRRHGALEDHDRR